MQREEIKFDRHTYECPTCGTGVDPDQHRFDRYFIGNVHDCQNCGLRFYSLWREVNQAGDKQAVSLATADVEYCEACGADAEIIYNDEVLRHDPRTFCFECCPSHVRDARDVLETFIAGHERGEYR